MSACRENTVYRIFVLFCVVFKLKNKTLLSPKSGRRRILHRMNFRKFRSFFFAQMWLEGPIGPTRERSLQFTLGAFHSIKTSRLNFRRVSVANGTVFSKTSKKEDNLARYTHIFSFHSTLLPGFLEFSVEWFTFWKFNSF